MKTKKTYYAVTYLSGRNTSIGTPNKKTGNMSTAVKEYAFSNKLDRDEWVNEYSEKTREAVTLKELRYLNQGMSMIDFNEMVENLKKYDNQ